MHPHPARPTIGPTIPALALLLCTLGGACDDDGHGDALAERSLESGVGLTPEDEPEGPEYFKTVEPGALPAINCAEKQDTGYVKGEPFAITVVTVDGKPVEVDTANAYYAMQQAAAADGVGIAIVSGFRTMAKQQELYNCYINCNCNNCNLAAKPGYSNHQSGHALDLNTGVASVKTWLENHAGEWGFARTVPKESWHYEWWGGGPPQDGPCGVPLFAGDPGGQSFPAQEAPPILLEVGETRSGWFELENVGKASWGSTTMLATSPDESSPLADASWPAPTRAARVESPTASGEIGRFNLVIRGNEPGSFVQRFSLVNEGEDQISWFAEDTLALNVLVVEPAPPEESASSTSTGTGDTNDDSTGGSTGGDSTGGDSTSDGSTSDAATTTESAEATTTAGATGEGLGDGGEAGCGCVVVPGRTPWPLLSLLSMLVLISGRRRRLR